MRSEIAKTGSHNLQIAIAKALGSIACASGILCALPSLEPAVDSVQLLYFSNGDSTMPVDLDSILSAAVPEILPLCYACTLNWHKHSPRKFEFSFTKNILIPSYINKAPVHIQSSTTLSWRFIDNSQRSKLLKECAPISFAHIKQFFFLMEPTVMVLHLCHRI